MNQLPTQTDNEDDYETLREYAEWRFKKSDSEDFSEWLEKEAKNDPVLKKYFITTKNIPQSSIIMDSEGIDSDKVSKKGTFDSLTKANDDFTSGMTLKEAQEIAAEKAEAERIAAEKKAAAERAKAEKKALREALNKAKAAEKEAAEKTRTIEEKILDVEDKEDIQLTENINEVLRWRFEKSESKDYSEWLENEAKHDPVVKQHLLTTNVLLVTEEGALIGQSPSSKPSKIEPPYLLEGIGLVLMVVFALVFLPMSFIIGLMVPDLLSIVIIISVIISIIIIYSFIALGDAPLEHVIISLCYIWFCVFIFYSGANTCIMFCEGQEVLLPFPDG